MISLGVLKFKDNCGVNDMTKTAERDVYAVAAQKGLFMVKSEFEGGKFALKIRSIHLSNANIEVISYIRKFKVLLDEFKKDSLIVFDYS